MLMDSAIAGLLGAIIGASAGILGSIVTSHLQLKLEEEKTRLAQVSAVSSELRAEIKVTAQYMLSLQHSMEWVCWLATKDEALPDDETVAQYHKEIHETIPKLLGALAAVSSFDQTFYDELAPLADQLFSLDGQIADALVRYKAPPERAAVIKDFYPEATKFYKKLPRQLSDIQKRVIESRKLDG